jgi:HAD superfamily hydrolase (TIGR01509 family)
VLPVWKSIGSTYLDSLGIPAPDNLMDAIKPLTLFETAQYFHRQLKIPYDDREIARQLDSMIADLYKYRLALKSNVVPFLERLQFAGVRMCIATATDRYHVEAALNRLKINHYFDFIITCTEVGVGKTEPVIYQKALEMLHTRKEETFIFEDALHAILTAKQAGFLVAGVSDESTVSDSEKIKNAADIYITSFEDSVFDSLLNSNI